MWGREKFVDSLFALHRYAMLENGRILARKVSGFHSFVVSFLTQEEADRFVYNFLHDPAGGNFTEFKPAPRYEAKCVLVGEIIPKDIMQRLADRLASDPDLVNTYVQKMMELERKYPDADFVFKLSEEVKQAWLAQQAKRKKQ
jgi:hypothetical protein